MLEYAQWLEFNLCFQGFEEELRTLPGKYAPPEGRLCSRSGTAASREWELCAPWMRLQSCDIKRLYVRPAFRGQLLAVRAQRPIREAHHIGYEKVRLDTVPGKIKQGHSAVSPLGVQDDNPFIMPLPCSIHCSWSLNWLLVLPRSAPGEGILRIFFHCADLVKSR